MRGAVGECVYALLLRAYPRAFRERYATQLLAAFRADRGQRGYEGGWGAFRFWAHIARDVASSAGSAWVERGRRARSVDGAGQFNDVRRRMTFLRLDLGQGARTLMREPSFTVPALIAVVLGVGVGTAAYAVVDAIMLRGLPYEEPDALVFAMEMNAEQTGSGATSPETYRDWGRLTTSFEGLGAWAYNARVLRTESGAESLTVVDVSATFFDVLGRSALLGRAFTAADGDAGARLAVLSESFWRSRYGSDAGVLGRSMEFDGQPYTIVGVMPGDFTLPDGNVPVWTLEDWSGDRQRASRYLGVIGRLADGSSEEQARAELDAIATRLAEAAPATNAGWTPVVLPLRERVVGAAADPVWLIAASVGLLLLVACFNVAGLVVARTAARRKEFAVRQALGGGWRVSRLLFAESALLFVVGAAVSLLFANALIAGLMSNPPVEIPLLSSIRIDGRATLFAIAATAVCALFHAVYPAVQAGRRGEAGTLRMNGVMEARGGGIGIRSALIGGEIALSVMLVIGAVLLVRTLRAYGAVEMGFEVENRVAARVFPDGPQYRNPIRRNAWVSEVERELSSLPGVRAVGSVSTLPLDPISVQFDLPYRVRDMAARPAGELPQADFRVVSGALFEALGIALLEGRSFGPADDADAPRVIVVNETFARQEFGTSSAIGERITMLWGQGTEFEIIGVTSNTRFASHAGPAKAEVYVHYPQLSLPFGSTNFVILSEAPAASLVNPVQRAIVTVDPSQPAHSVVPVASLVTESLARERFAAQALLGLGALSLVLAAIGLYALIAYVVRRRAREIAIRMALGAGREQTLSLVLRQSLTIAAVGCGVGLVGAATGTRLIERLLFGISALDPLTYAAAPAGLLVVALLAAAGPAWKAANTHPHNALRND